MHVASQRYFSYLAYDRIPLTKGFHPVYCLFGTSGGVQYRYHEYIGAYFEYKFIQGFIGLLIAFFTVNTIYYYHYIPQCTHATMYPMYS